MQYIIKVRILREQLSNKTSGIQKQSGIYCWWFKKDVALKLLANLPLNADEKAKIQKRDIDGEEYWALYFGISKDMLGRANWHVMQSHTESAVKNGTLSTLRNTIGALLNKDMSKSQNIVNNTIDTCYWEWEYNSDPKEVENNELTSTTKCYPLNIQENQTVSKEVLKALKKMRRLHKDKN